MLIKLCLCLFSPLQPIHPKQDTEVSKDLFERHCKLSVEYVKLIEKIHGLEVEWAANVERIIGMKRISASEAAKYKTRITQYCNLIAIKVGVPSP